MSAYQEVVLEVYFIYSYPIKGNGTVPFNSSEQEFNKVPNDEV